MLAVAIFIAPFIAWLFAVEAGLAVMCVALLATTVLVREAASTVPVRAQSWLRIAVGVNLFLALACAAAAVWLLTGS
jgi:hypothetical protein